tara:strand:- start:2106 stop:2582 length:477 start_codon:yes stop_codon:yes gene_type:complete
LRKKINMIKKIKFPSLSFAHYFSGEIEALGHMIFFYPKKRIKNAKIKFYGTYSKNILTLKEDYQDNEDKILRKWVFEKVNNNYYLGKEKNVIGNVIVKSESNYLMMNYKFKTNYKAIKFIVSVQDYMYQIDEIYLINKTKIYKFGIVIAESIMLYKKL